jgi:hypothetical protein
MKALRVTPINSAGLGVGKIHAGFEAVAREEARYGYFTNAHTPRRHTALVPVPLGCHD